MKVIFLFFKQKNITKIDINDVNKSGKKGPDINDKGIKNKKIYIKTGTSIFEKNLSSRII